MQSMDEKNRKRRSSTSEASNSNKRFDSEHLLALCQKSVPNLKEIESLLHDGANTNFTNRNGDTALLLLIKNRKHDYTGDHIEWINAGDRKLSTEQNDSTKDEYFLQIIKLFIQYRVNINHTEKQGGNALTLLCWKYKQENLIDIVRLLIENGIDVHCKHNGKWNAFLNLCRFYNKKNLIDIIRLLIEKGIDVHCKDSKGWNALMLLCRHYDRENLIDIVRLLIENGVSMNCETSDNKIAFSNLLFRQEQANQRNIAKVLIRHGFLFNKESANAHDYAQKFHKLSEECSGDSEYFSFMANEGITLGWHLDCKSCELIRLVNYTMLKKVNAKYRLFPFTLFIPKYEYISFSLLISCPLFLRSIEKTSRRQLQHHQKFENINVAFYMIMEDIKEEDKTKLSLEESNLDRSNLVEWLRNSLQGSSHNTKEKAGLCLDETAETIDASIKTIEELCNQIPDETIDSSNFNCEKYKSYLTSMHLIAKHIGANKTMKQIEWFYLLPFDYPSISSNDSVVSVKNNMEENTKQIEIEWDETIFSWAHKPGDESMGNLLKDDAKNALFISKNFLHKCHDESEIKM